MTVLPIDEGEAPADGRKHIALLAPLLSKSNAGLSFYVSNLVPHLCDAGHRVTVLTTDCGYAGADAGELVPIDARAEMKLFQVKGGFNRRVCRSPEMVHWFRQNCSAFDVVDMQGIWNWVTANIAQACREANVPYVITPHGMMARWDWAKRPLAKRVYFRFVYQECWRSAAAVRFLSAGERDNCMVPPQAPIAVIPNAVSPGADDMSFRDLEQFKTRLNISPSVQIVLFLGRITPQKGLLELIEAFGIVRQQSPNAVLAVAGWMDGEYGEAVQAQAARSASRDHIRFLGPVHGQVKAGLFASASVFVTLSRNEGQPIAVLEALANGIPAVLTMDSNIPEVSEYAAGVITELKPERAAEAISGLLLDEERRRAMAGNARRLAVERFSWDTVLTQLTRLYEEAARRQ